LERRECVRPSLQDLNHGLLPITLAPSSKKRKEERRREEKRGEWATYIHSFVIAHASPTLLKGFVLRHNTRIWESN
jgi:hypothetical protein